VAHIHPSCCISPQAQIGHDVEMGPYCVIEADVQIGDGCRLEAHVVIKSGTRLGRANYLAEGVILGGLPQHKRAVGNPGRLEIGDQNTLREHVTIHRGLTAADVTRLGDNNLLMVNSHVAHDCQVGDDVILANNVMLAGHVTVANRAYLSGAVAVHQYCRVGAMAMVGGQAHITKDVPPYVTVDGLSSMIVGLNLVGLKRAGFDAASLTDLKAAYRLAFRGGLRWEEMLRRLTEGFPAGPAAEFHRFMAATRRGCIQERALPRRATLRLHQPAPGEATAAATSEASENRATA
jgi:UDP-N-acetylglucosamine acyltransferase